MNILSLFDGISVGYLALQRAGVEVNKYYASEIDEYAIQVSEKNYPDIIRLGDVQDWKRWDIDWSSIDLLIGGSPCQGFSFAGKQLNFEDERSKLFFEYVDILNHLKAVNPDIKFLLENVRMKKEYQDIITEHLGVQPVMIDSTLVSAQRRKRVYWTNIADIKPPCDKGILLKDIVHETADLDTAMSESWCKWFKERADMPSNRLNIFIFQSRSRLIFMPASSSPFCYFIICKFLLTRLQLQGLLLQENLFYYCL